MFSLTPAGIQVPSPSPINLGGKMVHLLEIFETTGGTCGVMGSPFFDAWRASRHHLFFHPCFFFGPL